MTENGINLLISDAFNKYAEGRIFKPYNRAAHAHIYGGTNESGISVSFAQLDKSEMPLGMKWKDFLEVNELNESEFYSASE